MPDVGGGEQLEARRHSWPTALLLPLPPPMQLQQLLVFICDQKIPMQKPKCPVDALPLAARKSRQCKYLKIRSFPHLIHRPFANMGNKQSRIGVREGTLSSEGGEANMVNGDMQPHCKCAILSYRPSVWNMFFLIVIIKQSRFTPI